ncbi:[ribosomal protein S18]-alanine N-acetyltransferase [Methylomarinovum caldicuralii]|uniref:[Ribosomal protein bS18]-alanine N-acetyltransferase n=1 Tax=Methylomarinovum caldicuralii TaxID=438856 RepID=A0AAU9C2B8_9GAMM|nr:ribosomal protein S18-alanine N-acetyltransferase [Methylomarinovum caldicuralii]BCX82532.1 [ribosomal protein S18]-alanine N-acetyltransferase [Methylomarinovum caldicuralii]
MVGLFQVIRQWWERDPQKDFYARFCPDTLAEVEIRPMKKRDLKAVAAIEASAYQFPWSLNIFKNCLKTGYSCWVAEAYGEIVGYGILSLGVGEAHVMNLCVAPDKQGQGYGRKLLEHLIGVAEKEAAEMMFLEVRPSNEPAIRLYHRLGFNEVGRRKDYYPAADGKREDALILARSLGTP